MGAKKKTSVEDTISEFFLYKKDKYPGDLFDVGTSKGLVNISLSRIIQDKGQPRKTFNQKTIKELSDSIKEQGVINPITVRPLGEKYIIVAGERRFLAARQAGLKVVPAVIREVSKNEVRLISLVENLHREDLNSIDRAEGIKALKESLSLPWTEVAKKLGLSKQRVLDLVGLLNLPDEIKEDIRTRRLTEKHGRALRKLKGGKSQILKVTKIVKDKKLSGDEALKLAKEVKTRFGSRSVYSEKEFLKSKTEHGPFFNIVKACQNLLLEIKNIKEGPYSSTDISENDRKELKEVFLTVTEKIENLIKTYNLQERI